jgi:hypothetical protein
VQHLNRSNTNEGSNHNNKSSLILIKGALDFTSILTLIILIKRRGKKNGKSWKGGEIAISKGI